MAASRPSPRLAPLSTPSPTARPASRRVLIATIAVLVLACVSLPASAVVRRCIGPDGGTIYTDRPCDQFNARDQPAAPPALAPGAISLEENTGPVRSDCARSPEGLLFDIRRAVESSNINALAGLYHWPGTGGRAAVSIMNRLEDLTTEPGASVDLIYPESAFVVDNPAAYPDLPVENPSGVRISRYVDAQTGVAPERVLGLIRHAGCWWIRF